MNVESETTETTAPDTEAPDTTEAETSEVVETEAPASEDGCGSSVGLVGIALVMTLGTCTAFVAKKKEY